MAKLNGVLRKAGLGPRNRKSVEQTAREEIGADGSAPDDVSLDASPPAEPTDATPHSEEEDEMDSARPDQMSRPRAKTPPRTRKRDAAREIAQEREPASGRARPLVGPPQYVEPEERYGDRVRAGGDGERVNVFPAGRYNPPPSKPERLDEEDGVYLSGFRRRAAERSGQRIT